MIKFSLDFENGVCFFQPLFLNELQLNKLSYSSMIIQSVDSVFASARNIWLYFRNTRLFANSCYHKVDGRYEKRESRSAWCACQLLLIPKICKEGMQTLNPSQGGDVVVTPPRKWRLSNECYYFVVNLGQGISSHGVYGICLTFICQLCLLVLELNHCAVVLSSKAGLVQHCRCSRWAFILVRQGSCFVCFSMHCSLLFPQFLVFS